MVSSRSSADKRYFFMGWMGVWGALSLAKQNQGIEVGSDWGVLYPPFHACIRHARFRANEWDETFSSPVMALNGASMSIRCALETIPPHAGLSGTNGRLEPCQRLVLTR
jgi:hypothetical protein